MVEEWTIFFKLTESKLEKQLQQQQKTWKIKLYIRHIYTNTKSPAKKQNTLHQNSKQCILI